MAVQLYKTPTSFENKENIRETRYTSHNEVISEQIKKMMDLDILRDLSLKAMAENPNLSYEESYKLAKKAYLGEEIVEKTIELPLITLEDEIEIPDVYEEDNLNETSIEKEVFELPTIEDEVLEETNKIDASNFEENFIEPEETIIEEFNPESLFENITDDTSITLPEELIFPMEEKSNILEEDTSLLNEDLLSDLPTISENLTFELPEEEILLDVPTFNDDLLSDLPNIDDNLLFELPDNKNELNEIKENLLEDTLSRTLTGELQMDFKDEPNLIKSK